MDNSVLHWIPFANSFLLTNSLSFFRQLFSRLQNKNYFSLIILTLYAYSQFHLFTTISRIFYSHILLNRRILFQSTFSQTFLFFFFIVRLSFLLLLELHGFDLLHECGIEFINGLFGGGLAHPRITYRGPTASEFKSSIMSQYSTIPPRLHKAIVCTLISWLEISVF